MKPSLKNTLMALTILSAGAMWFSPVADAASFSKAKPKQTGTNKNFDQYPKLGVVKDEVNAALDLHKTAFTLISEKQTLQDYRDAVEKYNEIQRRLNQNIQCNENSLNEHFTNGKAIWTNVSAWAEDSSAKLLATASNSLDSNNASSSDLKALEQKAQAGDYSDRGDTITIPETSEDYGSDMEMKELTAYAKVRWDVGNKVLKDIYATPEKWGKVSKKFSPWVDQKNSYNVYLKTKYDEMESAYTTNNSFPSFPARPRIFEGESYVPSDYFTGEVPVLNANADFSGKTADERWCGKGNKCERVNKGGLYTRHMAYVAALKAMPLRSGKSVPDMKAPYLPSTPLPPWRESVFILNTEKELPELGSALPEPWKRITQNIDMFSADGEMANLVERKGNSVRFRPDDYNAETGEVNLDKNGNPKIPLPLQINRISSYLALKDALTEQEPIKDRAVASIQELNSNLISTFAKMGYEVENPKEFNLANEADYQKAIKKLTELQNDKIQSAKQKMKALQNEFAGNILPSVSQMISEETKTMDALSKDKDFLVEVNRTNAPNIDGLLMSAIADDAANMTYKENLATQMQELSPVPPVGCPVL